MKGENMSFDEIPENKIESYPCKCGGNITKKCDKNGYAILNDCNRVVWECDKCLFQASERIK